MILQPPKRTFNREKAEFIKHFLLCRASEASSTFRVSAEIEIACYAWDEINKVCKIKTEEEK